MKTIRNLSNSDISELTDFFLKLKAPTYYYWNRFGELYEESKARKTAEIQCNIKPADEIGWVYNEDNIIMGYAYLRFFPDKEIKKYTTSLGIVVADEYQNKGIGKKLMNELLDYSKQNNYKKVWLATYTDNIRALKMYNNLGFEIEGIFMYDEYFDGKPRHVVSMALFLSDDCKNSKIERINFIKQIEN